MRHPISASGHAIDEVTPVDPQTVRQARRTTKRQETNVCEFSEKRDRRSLYHGAEHPLTEMRQRPHGASPSTLPFLQTKLSKNRKPNPPEPPSGKPIREKTSPKRKRTGNRPADRSPNRSSLGRNTTNGRAVHQRRLSGTPNNRAMD